MIYYITSKNRYLCSNQMWKGMEKLQIFLSIILFLWWCQFNLANVCTIQWIKWLRKRGKNYDFCVLDMSPGPAFLYCITLLCITTIILISSQKKRGIYIFLGKFFSLSLFNSQCWIWSWQEEFPFQPAHDANAPQLNLHSVPTTNNGILSVGILSRNGYLNLTLSFDSKHWTLTLKI